MIEKYPGYKDRFSTIEYHLNLPFYGVQTVEPMFQACSTLAKEFSGAPNTVPEPFMNSASVNYSLNRELPAYSMAVVHGPDIAPDTLFKRARFDEFSPVAVTIESSYDPVTKTVSGKVISSFEESTGSGDYRVVLLVKESGISKADTNYWQWSDLVPKPGNIDTNFIFNDVIRAEILNGSIWGKKGVISADPKAGEQFTADFSYTLPELYYDLPPKPENMQLIALVLKHLGTKKPTGPVLNCGFAPLNQNTTAVGPLIKGLTLNGLTVKCIGGSIELYTPAGHGAYQCDILSLSGKLLFRANVQAENGRAVLNGDKLSKGAYIIALKGMNSTSFGRVTIQ